jgi:hypothetical protein
VLRPNHLLSTGNVAASAFWTGLLCNLGMLAPRARQTITFVECERAYWPRPMLQAIEQSVNQRLFLEQLVGKDGGRDGKFSPKANCAEFRKRSGRRLSGLRVKRGRQPPEEVGRRRLPGGEVPPVAVGRTRFRGPASLPGHTGRTQQI